MTFVRAVATPYPWNSRPDSKETGGFDHCAIAAFFVLGVVDFSRSHRLHKQRSAEPKLPNQTKPNGVLTTLLVGKETDSLLSYVRNH